MLRSVDRVLAIVSVAAAAAVVIMLFAGPQVVAEDKPAPSAGAGQAVFTENCGSCHTLSRAGTSGQVGPDLDSVSLGPEEIQEIVRGGTGSMPSFEGKLSDAEISDVAKFVAGPDYSSSGR